MLPAGAAVAHASGGVDRRHFSAGEDGGARVTGGPLQFPGHRPHAADRHVPVARAAADQVVQEANVLLEVSVPGPGERADQGIGQDGATHQVVLQGAGDGFADGPFHHGLPCLRGPCSCGQCPRLRAGLQRGGHGGPERLGELSATGIEAVEGRRFALRGADGCERRRGGRGVAVVDQEAPPRVRRVRCVGRKPPTGQPDPEAQVIDDLLRQEADEIGVARKARRDAVERLG